MFQVHRKPDDPQAGEPELYCCVDGVMRTGYEKFKFEERVEWTWLGWRLKETPLRALRE
jgi:hypothetical protein